jgi:hypothetical protein
MVSAPRRRPPRTSCGAGEHLLRPRPPRHPADTLGLDQRPCRPGGQAAPQPGRRPGGGPGLRRPSCEPGTANAAHPFPSGPMQPGDYAARGPRGRSTGCAQPGAAHHTEPLQGSARRGQRGGSAADTGGLSVRTPDAPDAWTPDAWTPDAWTLDVRSTGWTDIPTAGPGSRTGQRPAWPASGHPRDRRPPAGRPTSPGSRYLGRLATQVGSAVTGTSAAALPAAATGQLPSTARYEAAPRRIAVVCWSWRVRGEGNGTTER